MGLKNIDKVESSEMENNNESQEGTNASKITWSKELIYILYDLCIKHTLWSKGKNGAIVSHKILWPKLVEEWKKVTGLPWDKPRLKNKLDGMRPKWILWKNLKSKETSLGWNYEKGTVEASEEWWSSKIQENSKFKQFKDEGIEPDLEVRLDQVFGGCAQGAEKFTPGGEVHDLQVEDDEIDASSPPPLNARFGIPPGYEEVESNLGNEEWNSLWKEPNPSSPNVLVALDMNDKRKGKRAMESDNSESNKSAKIGSIKTKGGCAALIERMDHMLQIIGERNNSTKEFQLAMANMMNSLSVAQPKYSETQAIDKLCSMSDFDLNSPEFYFACTLIENPQKRTILLELPDDKRRIEYIRYLYAQHKGGK